MNAKSNIEWPRWANLALVVIVLTSVTTIVATINDIW